ncbi:HAMP domain-containing sensor histidine kinase [Clostridium sartagoforme]|uniref:sensor histidine kinase n=1 Tax=Clostridium sartagoforme TaxID=84031 RepID=UPI0031DB95C0
MINILRNKEIRVLLTLIIGVSIIGVILSSIINPVSGIITFIVAFLIIYLANLFTLRRYKEIEKLSGYLRNISNGNYSMDIRDNEEGELSILKNEIYKVTLMLSKQGEFLKKDKEKLADAISDISHQLKTPLTSMMVMIDLLSEENLNLEKRIEFTKNIEMQLERMDWLLTSLLKLSKIDAGTITFKKDKVKVSELIKKAMSPLLIPMELKEQKIIVDGNENTSFTGDLNWSIEAIVNIVKNCIEHTKNKGVISIFYEENPLYTEIKILDNGSGIEKEDLPYIFKRFYKGKNASAGSVGIGLAMAKSIIVSQNGDISVRSKKNQGTEFSIKFYNKQK